MSFRCDIIVPVMRRPLAGYLYYKNIPDYFISDSLKFIKSNAAEILESGQGSGTVLGTSLA